MIASFKGKMAPAIFDRQRVRSLDNGLQRTAYRKLVAIHIADTVEELRVPPGNRLEKLKGARSGQYSLRINDQWRICFRWEEGHAYDVEIVDYH